MKSLSLFVSAVFLLAVLVLTTISSVSAHKHAGASHHSFRALSHKTKMLLEEQFIREKHNRPWYKESESYKQGKLKLTPEDCEVRYFEQPVDHFSAQPPVAPFPKTFKQRYFVCGLKYWKPGQPIFYYTGNESPVTLYVNVTGLMYENAPTFGALVVFGECRYFGESLIFPGEPMPSKDKLRYLSMDQVANDHARLISNMKYNIFGNSSASKIFLFGGSWGGMQVSYITYKFGALIDGAIAGSAPIFAFEKMENPPYNPNACPIVETNDAGPLPAGESKNPYCADTIRMAWQDILQLAESESGRASLTKALRLCNAFPSPSTQSPYDFLNYFSAPYGNLAMSSYSFASSYLLLGGAGILPAYPMTVACDSFTQSPESLTAEERVTAMANSLMVYFNASGEFTCIDINKQVNKNTAITGYLWGALACSTQVLPSGQSGRKGPGGDMFWNAPWNATAYAESCQQEYNYNPDFNWARNEYGGRDILKSIKNIFYSTGGLDIWTPGSPQPDQIPKGREQYVSAFTMPRQGHHADLFFSHENDTDDLKQCRRMEVAKIAEWLTQ